MQLPWSVNLAFLVAGAVLQGIAAFDTAWAKPYSAGLLTIAGVFLMLGKLGDLKRQKPLFPDEEKK